MAFEWDQNKSETNQKKHGFSFEAMEDFDWSLATCLDIQTIDCEERELWVGPIRQNLVAAIVTVRNGTTRIISLRRATNHEIRLWKEAFQDD